MPISIGTLKQEIMYLTFSTLLKTSITQILLQRQSSLHIAYLLYIQE